MRLNDRKSSRWRKRLYVAGLVLVSILGLSVFIVHWYSVRVNQLIGHLQDPNPTVRADAADALWDLYSGRSAESPFPFSLPYRLHDGRPIRPLLSLLRDPDAKVREKAIGALAAADPTPPLAPLTAALGSPDTLERETVAELLSRIAFSHKELGPALAPLFGAALRDSDHGVQESAVSGFYFCGRSSLEPLTAALVDNDATVRLRAASVILGSQELSGEPGAKAALMDVLQRQDTQVIARFYEYFIHQGAVGSEDALVQTLKTRGDKGMAEAFLNCGNRKLEAAALAWAAEHRLVVTTKMSSGSVQWPAPDHK